MDIVTQALLGGVLAQSVADRTEKKHATIAGAIAGLLADADIFIYSSSDPLLNIELHRHFTHSLFFIPFGGAIAALLLWPFLKQHMSAKRLYLFCVTGYSMSGVLDACTSYGTHLLWPLSNERVAWNLISIVDPVFSMVLIVSLVLGLRMRQKNIARIGLLFCLLYMASGFVQLHRAEQMAESLALSRNHQPGPHVVKPSLGNLVLWRSVYIYNDEIFVDAIRVGLFSANRIYEGESVKRFNAKSDLVGLSENSTLYKDIERFRNFSDGYIAYDPGQSNVIGDLRYSMLPDSIIPLWGIMINPEIPQLHADYRFFRDNSSAVKDRFIDMLYGRCVTETC